MKKNLFERERAKREKHFKIVFVCILLLLVLSPLITTPVFVLAVFSFIIVYPLVNKICCPKCGVDISNFLHKPFWPFHEKTECHDYEFCPSCGKSLEGEDAIENEHGKRQD